jgi:hypothetical protein
MKRMLFIAAAGAALFSANSLAESFKPSYATLTMHYGAFDVDHKYGDDVMDMEDASFNRAQLEASIPLGDYVFIKLSGTSAGSKKLYETPSLLDDTRSQITYSRYQGGLGIHLPINETTDFVTSYTTGVEKYDYTNISVDMMRDEFQIGVRGMLTDTIEYGVSAKSEIGEGIDVNIGTISLLRWHFDPGISLGIQVDTVGDEIGQNVSIQFNF